MYYDQSPPPRFEYVDINQYTNEEILGYISELCEFMKRRDAKIKKVEGEQGNNYPYDSETMVEDIPF